VQEFTTSFEHLIQGRLAFRVGQVGTVRIAYAGETQAFEIDSQIDIF